MRILIFLGILVVQIAVFIGFCSVIYWLWRFPFVHALVTSAILVVIITGTCLYDWEWAEDIMERLKKRG